MKGLGIKIALLLNYFVFAILLNSVGTVILQVQRNYDITKDAASVLEGFKDLPIAITSFLLASFLPKIGLKRSMMIGLILVAACCCLMPFTDAFWYFKVLFMAIGISFALIKVSVFATIGLVTDDAKQHASFMSVLEAFFMAGILVGNVAFSLFVDDANPKSQEWYNMYWFLGGLSLLALVVLWFSKLDESAAKIESRSLKEDFYEMFRTIAKPLVLVFIVSVFLYVLIEQSFQTWFPTFYQDILSTPSSMAIQAGAVLGGATMIGRFASGAVLARIKWIYVLSVCLIAVAAIILLALPLAGTSEVSGDISWTNAPLVVYLMPLLDFFLAPIYPTINSTILSSQPKYMHSSVSGLIVIFSALGGTTGSIITGHVFEAYDGATAFYFALVPVTLILIAIWIFYRMIQKQALTA